MQNLNIFQDTDKECVDEKTDLVEEVKTGNVQEICSDKVKPINGTEMSDDYDKKDRGQVGNQSNDELNVTGNTNTLFYVIVTMKDEC